MKSVGTYISGGAHVGLVVWMVVGWGTDADPLPMEVTEVTMVSGDDFAALTQGIQPDLPPGGIEEPEQPQIDEPDPEPPTPTPIEETPPEVPTPPAPIETPQPEAPPEPPDVTVPETVVTDTPPDVPDTPTIVAPPPNVEVGTSLRPVSRPAPVRPEPVAQPEPEVAIAPESTVAPTEQSEEPVEDEPEVADETTAPEEAADVIVTEAEEPSFAPEISTRPSSRPTRTATAEPDEETETETVSTTGGETPTEPEVDPVAVALAEAAANPGLGGGELSDRQRADLRREISSCWNVGSASTAALNTTITVEWVMNPNGTIDDNSVELVGFSGGAQADADVAFNAAFSAIVRCQRDNGRSGYTLPAGEFQEPVRLRLTFDPSEMRLR